MAMLFETLSRLARLLFWPALILALTMAVMPNPPRMPPALMVDKVQHMLAFFTLTILFGIGWPKGSLVRAVLFLSMVGAGIEILQLIPMIHRDADWADWIADSFAILVALLPVMLFRRLSSQFAAA